MGFFTGATKVVKRLGAFIAGILLTLAGGNLVYASFKSDNPFLSKFAWFVLFAGLVCLAYGFMSSQPAKSETPGIPESPKQPEQSENQQ